MYEQNAPNGVNTQTDKHTDGHGDSMTESAQGGRFSEKGKFISLKK